MTDKTASNICYKYRLFVWRYSLSESLTNLMSLQITIVEF